MSFHAIIPVRYQARRLPGKPLLDINGKPIVQHVYERALCAQPASLTIATDDVRIAEVAESFGATVCMTRSDHLTGTDRLAEVVQTLDLPDSAVVVNVQGDEPCIPPENIQQVAQNLSNNPEASIATLAEPITTLSEKQAVNNVKVIADEKGMALYFSRAPIPHGEMLGTRHIGLYAYRAAFLKKVSAMSPCALEQAESLEQLRWLWHGYRIHVALAQSPSPIGVDTEEDLQHIRALLKQDG